MAQSAKDVLNKHLSAEQLLQAKARSEELIIEYKTLQELRKARDLTQTRMAELLNITQDNVSRLEKRSDVLLSTLRSYVEAMGGELDLVAKFPNKPPVHIQSLGDLGSEQASDLK
ncbi:XRE family transcriptional regulator [uncultured Cohaesibacter sp.]|uniref:XRE family transcriptional regulator n=1 Tax=uncultured Cohaesibacter sp. TaxID=1002546 RepID=UPI002AA8C971|nr:XRE family transcriptional regulator [uncultured Cohaesibacter sp.]